MGRLRHLVAVGVMLGVGTVSTFAQQRHVMDQASLAATVRQHVDAQQQDRTVIRETLARPDVRHAASSAGVDLERLATAVETLSPAELARTAAAARDVSRTLDQGSLVGGASTVTISTTTIIIGLLILILLIVALD